jgi:hypothetical protein
MILVVSDILEGVMSISFENSGIMLNRVAPGYKSCGRGL